jgi:hypothetical protein
LECWKKEHGRVMFQRVIHGVVQRIIICHVYHLKMGS